MNLSLPTKAKLHFVIGYLREASKTSGIDSAECAFLAEKLESAPNVAALQADLIKALEEK